MGYATSALSGRNPSNVCNDQNLNSSSLTQLISQLTALVKHLASLNAPSVNIYNRYSDEMASSQLEKSTQTTPLNSTTSNAEQPSHNNIIEESNSYIRHNSDHASSEIEEAIHFCTECGESFESSSVLDNHLTSHHDAEVCEAESNQDDLSAYFTFDDKSL